MVIKREQYIHVKLITELKIEPQSYYNYLRMDGTTYLKLLSTVIPLILEQDTVIRKAIRETNNNINIFGNRKKLWIFYHNITSSTWKNNFKNM